MGLCYSVIAPSMLNDMKGKQKWISNVSLNDRVFFFGWMHLLIEFNVKAGETIPKEGAIESHTFLHEVLAYIYIYIDIDWLMIDMLIILMC